MFDQQPSDVSQILSRIDAGDPRAAEHLLPLVYQELRKLAAARMRNEAPGQTLSATGLVHEAWIRLVDVRDTTNDDDNRADWNSRAHFFGAAAEAMRRILIERARRRARLKHGGGRRRIDLDSADAAVSATLDDLVAIDEALAKLNAEDAEAARLVRLHYYAGLRIEEAGELLGLSRTRAYELWCYARACLRVALE